MKNLYQRALSALFFTALFFTRLQAQQPNIILILADDVGYKSLSCNGGNLYSTPNLDTLAQNGMRFTQCHASPACSPSRFMLLTGKYNFRNYTEWGQMSRNEKTIGNMFKDAGYKTASFGKWQFGGGDESIKTFGFDDYTLHDVLNNAQTKSRYKSPHLYTHGNFLPDNLTKNKYGPDITSDSLLNFLDANKSNPFFIYYPMILVHQPFCPTPDDTAFASWDPDNHFDTSFFHSMMSYMDKEIGKLVHKLKELGIDSNTVIIFTGDNGTPKFVADYADENENVILGGKLLTTEAGTHVPLIIDWPGTVMPGTVNYDLIDFTDFLPTLAGIAGISKPVNYGHLDGVDFSAGLTGDSGTPRSSIFMHYNHDPAKPSKFSLIRWSQTKTYKLYDTSASKNTRLFYNINNDPQEKNPIADSLLTADETAIKQQLLDVINSYIMQGIPLFSEPAFSNITDSSALIQDTILINGGSTITSSGFVWGTKQNPAISSPHTTGVTGAGLLSNIITGLKPNIIYYVRAYAVNYAGTTYSNQISFRTSLAAPVANAAILIDSTGFIAGWKAVAGAASYRLDVSTLPQFAVITSSKLTQSFNNGLALPEGWSVTNNVAVNNNVYGKASPSAEFKASKAQIVTKLLSGNATQLKFWIKGLNTNASSSFLVEGFNGNEWIVIQKLKDLSQTGATKTFNATSPHPLPNNICRFRFTYTKSAGTLVFDDVIMNYDAVIPSFVNGFNNVTVKDTSKFISGLTAGINYYYRIRAVNNNGTSGNSNTINALTCTAPAINSIIINNLSCYGNNSGSINANASGVLLSYNWIGPDGFTSSDSILNNLAAGGYHLSLKCNGGCGIDTTVEIIQPDTLNVTVNTDSILCSGNSTILTINATGGTGDYHYTLSDGTNTSGPQDDNYFTVNAGSYTVIVEDDNHCSFTTSSIIIGEPAAINAVLNADSIECLNGSTILTINASGGTGNYNYTLFDGINTTGPQTDNHFNVIAGNYFISVADGNSCTFDTSIIINDGTQTCGALSSQNRRSRSDNAVAKNNNNRFSIEVYPNPASDYFSLKVESSSHERIIICITDIFGKKLYRYQGNNIKTYTLGEQLKAGMYFINVIQGKENKTIKVIKAD